MTIRRSLTAVLGRAVFGRAVFGLCALGAACAPATAQIVQTTAVPFLQIEPDSRAAGMGMTGVAVADNASALFWNPAGLAGQEGGEITFTHAPWLPALGADLFFEYLAGKYAVPGIGTFAGHLTFLNLGEQQRTDEQGQDLGTFRSYDLAVGASYGRHLTPTLALGGGLRLIYSNLAGNIESSLGTTRAGVSVGVDLGLLWKPSVGMENLQPSLGFNLANMGPHIRYSDSGQSDAIPSNLRIGGALDYRLDDFNRLTFALDLNKLIVARDSAGEYRPFTSALFSTWQPITVDIDGADQGNPPEEVGVLRQFTVGTGLEYWYNDLFALRTGYFYEDPANGNRKFLTFGAGIRYSLVGVDLSYIYALEQHSPLSEQIRFSVMLNVNR